MKNRAKYRRWRFSAALAAGLHGAIAMAVLLGTSPANPL
jgi:hypothetical protein